jgi:hypothetical protein
VAERAAWEALEGVRWRLVACCWLVEAAGLAGWALGASKSTLYCPARCLTASGCCRRWWSQCR